MNLTKLFSYVPGLNARVYDKYRQIKHFFWVSWLILVININIGVAVALCFRLNLWDERSHIQSPLYFLGIRSEGRQPKLWYSRSGVLQWKKQKFQCFKKVIILNCWSQKIKFLSNSIFFTIKFFQFFWLIWVTL